MESFEPKKPEAQNLFASERFSVDLNVINAMIEAMLANPSVDPELLKEAWTYRAILAENFVDSLQPTLDNLYPRSTAQLEIMIDKARMFERAGNQLRYLEELDAAETFGCHQRLDHVVYDFKKEIKEKAQELGNSPAELVLKLRGYIDFANREYLRDLIAEGVEYEDFLGGVYGMLLSEGENPEEVFKQLGITE